MASKIARSRVWCPSSVPFPSPHSSSQSTPKNYLVLRWICMPVLWGEHYISTWLFNNRIHLHIIWAHRRCCCWYDPGAIKAFVLVLVVFSQYGDATCHPIIRIDTTVTKAACLHWLEVTPDRSTCLRILIHIEDTMEDTCWHRGASQLLVAALCLAGCLKSYKTQYLNYHALTGHKLRVLFQLSMKIHSLSNFIGWKWSVLLIGTYMPYQMLIY